MTYLQLLGALLLIALCTFVWKRVRNRSRWVRATVIICLVGAGIISAGLTTSFLFAHLMCGEYVLPAVEAPDHSAIAQVREFDCGATTPFNSDVRVRSTKSVTGRLGWNRWHTVFTIEHDPRLISLTWTGHELTIRHPIAYRHPEYLKCDSMWGDIKITCESYKPNEAAPLSRLPEPDRWYW